MLTHNWFSDHCPIMTTIATNKTNKITNKWDNTITTPTPPKFFWSEQGAATFHKISQGKDTQESLIKLRHDSDPDEIATKFENIILDIANKSLKTTTHTTSRQTNPTQQWMTEDLRKERKFFVKAKKAFLGEKNNKDRRLFYMNKKRKLKKKHVSCKTSVPGKKNE